MSRKGLREGVFYEELTKDLGISYYPNVVEESLYLLSHEYEMDMEFVMQLIKHGRIICQQLEETGLISMSEKDWEVFQQAAKVFNIGKYIDDEASRLHTFYLLANKTIDGMMHKDRVRLALIASYKSKCYSNNICPRLKDGLIKMNKKNSPIRSCFTIFSSSKYKKKIAC